MKTKSILAALLCVFILFAGCSKKDDNNNDDDNSSTTGTLKFQTLNPIADGGKSIKGLKSNPSLFGDTTAVYTTSLKLCIGDVWVSQGEVMAGQSDNLEWVRLTSATNKDIKLFEDYTFSEIEIPAGDYKSIKMTFRNIWYRHCQLVTDSSVIYELLETMGSWSSPCDTGDTTWARTNFFGPGGNCFLNDSNVFELASAGEKVGGFTIEGGKTAVVTWRLGAGATEPCTTYLIDVNSNLEWDCGTDEMDFDCPPGNNYMWDFVVTYE